ncbi:hypothetical protein AYO49_00675 [Verrucomicrobiaceae bacterium SCGC AG-212-N21]|nr:hypothetical protein AYO49_00675 [Verrucomicrobiaceae bacterium SCGC AG-212-N21]
MNPLLATLAIPALICSSLLAADPAGWIKSAKNPMLSLGKEGDFDSQNLFGPCVAKEGGKYFMFYCGGPAGPKTGEDHVRYQLGLALSDDGETWQKTGKPLLPLGERDNFHAAPALLREPTGNLLKIDGVWHMVYCGNRADDIEHATSRDGRTWEKDPRSPIFKSAYSPSLVKVGDEFRMYYISKPPKRDGKSVPWEVHLATGPDLYSLKPHASNPVLVVSQSWEKGALFYPCVLKEDDTWVMFYAAYWRNHPRGKGATAIGIASSSDGVSWKKNEKNPVLTPTPDSAYDSIYNSSESVIRDGEIYRLYYGGRVDMVHKYFSIGLATKKGRLVKE